MTENANEPREGLTPGVREDQAAGGGRSVVSMPQPSDSAQQAGLFPTEVPQEPLSARPLVLVTRGRVEYLAHCPHCKDWHRHVHLGKVSGPCGVEYELQPRRGRAA